MPAAAHIPCHADHDRDAVTVVEYHIPISSFDTEARFMLVCDLRRCLTEALVHAEAVSPRHIRVDPLDLDEAEAITGLALREVTA